MALALSADAVGTAEVLAGYGIAINLAYLNLPNLRFPQRIKARLRQVIREYEDVYEYIEEGSEIYPGVYELGDFGEFREMPVPQATDSWGGLKSGGIFVDLFMLIWCTPVKLTLKGKNRTLALAALPIDKLVAAILLSICNLYLFFLMTAKIAPADAVRLLSGPFDLFQVCVAAIVISSLARRDIVTAIVAGVSMLLADLSIYWPDSLPFVLNASDPTRMLQLLICSVLITSLLVAFSHLLYPAAERHFVSQTTQIFAGAKKERDRRKRNAQS
jgi:hypothetical protein